MEISRTLKALSGALTVAALCIFTPSFTHAQGAEKKEANSEVKKEEHDHDHGPREDLGTTTVAALEISVEQAGALKAG